MNRPILVAHDAGNFHIFNPDGTEHPIALYYNGTNHYQALVGHVPASALQKAIKPVATGNRGGAASSIAGRTRGASSVNTVASGNRGGIPSSVCGRTVRNASCSASSVGGRTKQCRSLSKASPAVGRTPKRSPSTAVAMSNFVNASGARCSKAETLLLQKRFASTMKLNKKNADARKRKKSKKPGLASSDTCLCGWKVPIKRYQDDQIPAASVAHIGATVSNARALTHRRPACLQRLLK